MSVTWPLSLVTFLEPQIMEMWPRGLQAENTQQQLYFVSNMKERSVASPSCDMKLLLS